MKTTNSRKVLMALLASMTFFMSPSLYAQSDSNDTGQNSSQENGSQGNTENTQLQQMTVTGYIIPRIGDGPADVEHLDNSFLQKTGSTDLSDALQHLPNNMNVFTAAANNWRFIHGGAIFPRPFRRRAISHSRLDGWFASSLFPCTLRRNKYFCRS